MPLNETSPARCHDVKITLSCARLPSKIDSVTAARPAPTAFAVHDRADLVGTGATRKSARCDQVKRHSKRTDAGEAKQHRNDQVVRRRRHDAEQQRRHGDQNAAVIVIVDVTAGEPRVVRGNVVL